MPDQTKAFLAQFVCVVAAATALLLQPELSVAHDHNQVLHCSNNGAVGALFVMDITAQQVPCSRARRFIVGVNDHRVQLKVRNTQYRGYKCHPRQTGAAGWIIRCTHRRQLIRWLEGT